MSDFTTSIKVVGYNDTGNRIQLIQIALIDATKKNPRIYIEDCNWSSGYGIDEATDKVTFIVSCYKDKTVYNIYYIKDNQIFKSLSTTSNYSRASSEHLVYFQCPYANVAKTTTFDFSRSDLEFTAADGVTKLKNGELVSVINGVTTVQNEVTLHNETKQLLATDEEFYNNYKLDWNTYAQTYNLPR